MGKEAAGLWKAGLLRTGTQGEEGEDTGRGLGRGQGQPGALQQGPEGPPGDPQTEAQHRVAR